MLEKHSTEEFARRQRPAIRRDSLSISLAKVDIIGCSEIVLFSISVFMLFLFNFSAGIGSKLTNLSIALFIAEEFILAMAHNRRIVGKELAAYLAFCGISILSAFYSENFNLSVGRCSTLLQLMGYALALYSFFSITTRDRVIFAFRVLMFAGIVSAIYLLTVGDWQGGNRLNDIIGDSNTSGAYLALVATGLFWGLKTGYFPKLLSLLGLILLAFTVLLNGSRSVFIAFLVGLLAMQLLFSPRPGRISWSKLLGLVMIVAIIAIIIHLAFSNSLFYEILGRRIQSVFEILAGKQSNIRETSMTGRIDLMSDALFEFAQSPLLGMGINSFVSRYGYFAHNDFLELLATVGLSGFATFYMQYFFIVQNTSHAGGTSRYFIWVALIQIFITHCFVVFYYQKLEMLFIVFLVSLSKIELSEDKHGEM